MVVGDKGQVKDTGWNSVPNLVAAQAKRSAETGIDTPSIKRPGTRKSSELQAFRCSLACLVQRNLQSKCISK